MNTHASRRAGADTTDSDPSEQRAERVAKDIASIAYILQSQDFTVLRRLIVATFLLICIDFGLRLFIWIIAFLRFMADQGY